MTANAHNDSAQQLALLLLPARKEAYVLNLAALKRGQATRSELEQGYRDALILYPGGEVRRIERVVVLGPYGDSFWRRLLSRMTDAWEIAVELSAPLDIALGEIKSMMLAFADRSGDNLGLANDEAKRAFVRSVEVAGTMAALFAGVGHLEPERALDVL